MIKIEENIKKLKGLRNRLAVVALATGLTFTGSGCEKDKNAGEEVGYNLISDSGRTSGLYTYIIKVKDQKVKNIILMMTLLD